MLSCFCAFWFTTPEPEIANSRIPDPEQIVASIALTVAYLLFVTFLLFRATHLIDYDGQEYHFVDGPLNPGLGFEDQIAAALDLSLWLSPIATAPVIVLTNGTDAKS